MGTLVGITLYAANPAMAKAAFERGFARIAALNRLFSDYLEDSEVNALSTTPRKVSRELYEILRFAREVSRASNGAFDVTIGPLTRLWRQKLPLTPEAKALVDWQALRLERGRVWFTKPGMKVDLGAIGKGFAADAAARACELDNVLIAASGDIVCRGAPPGESGWRVQAAGVTLRLRNAAVSTSGDARQYFERNGVRYSHIIDPRSGLSMTTQLEVSAVARNGMTADALATAVRVSGDTSIPKRFGAQVVAGPTASTGGHPPEFAAPGSD